MQLTVEKLQKVAGELAIVKILLEEEVSQLRAEVESLKKQSAVPASEVEFEEGVSLCAE